MLWSMFGQSKHDIFLATGIGSRLDTWPCSANHRLILGLGQRKIDSSTAKFQPRVVRATCCSVEKAWLRTKPHMEGRRAEQQWGRVQTILSESLSYPAVPWVRPISGCLCYMSQYILVVLCLNQSWSCSFSFFPSSSVIYNWSVPVCYSLHSQGDMCMILSPEIIYLKYVCSGRQNQECCKNTSPLIQTKRKSSVLF